MEPLRRYVAARAEAARRGRERAWRMRDSEDEIWHLVHSRPQYEGVRQAHRRACWGISGMGGAWMRSTDGHRWPCLRS
jgi:hypothetical protein